MIPHDPNHPLTYLAVPYSNINEAIKLHRFHTANKAAAYLMAKGELVFSPISHTHPIAVDGQLPGDWLFWEKFDRAYLNYCWKIVVLMLPGWDTSKGVQAELKIAGELKLVVEYLNPELVG
jgi:hypothetical protein